MKPHIFAKKIYMALKRNSPESISLFDGKREFHMAFVSAAYGEKSAVAMQFEGSPPWLTIFISGLQYHWVQWSIFIDGRKITGQIQHPAIAKICHEFLKQHLPE